MKKSRTEFIVQLCQALIREQKAFDDYHGDDMITRSSLWIPLEQTKHSLLEMLKLDDIMRSYNEDET